jgi:hypothetical protein
MGGSSFLFTCAAIGIILSVARNVEQLEGKEPLLEPLITVKENKEVLLKQYKAFAVRSLRLRIQYVLSRL